MTYDVALRPVVAGDVEVFYEHQADPEAAAMAAFSARDASSHAAHWATKILADDTVVARTIVCDGEVAGNVVSWMHDGRREVGYWIGRAFWGRGIASAALAQLVDLLPDRPLHAYVAAHNRGSLRVLEKCGFVRTGAETSPDGVDGVLMELRERGKAGPRGPAFPGTLGS